MTEPTDLKTCIDCGESKPIWGGFYAGGGRRCKDCVKRRRKAIYDADPDRYRADARQWYADNRERAKANVRRYRDKEGPERRNQEYLRRKARLQEMLDKSYAERGIAGRCWMCGKPINGRGRGVLDNDHLIPQEQGGPDELWNLAPTHASCNRQRKEMSLEETVKTWSVTDPVVLAAVRVALERFGNTSTSGKGKK